MDDQLVERAVGRDLVAEIGIVATGAILMTIGLLLARPRTESEQVAGAPSI